ncbi:MAG: pyridoxal phosphate-dependent aminotransferase [Clostridia bacterium]|nr:pyridoxal phosphate-dependent aminotransferase [Clostridia bacterium]
MFNEYTYGLGTTRSCIRELFDYGLKQAAIVGKENVYDFSIGNPSIPAPQKVNEAIIDIVSTEDSLLVHGYTSAPGIEELRTAVAEELAGRMGVEIKLSNLFFTCGAAPALTATLKALHIGPETEILAIAPFFPEYRPFVEGTGSKFRFVPANTKTFQIDFESLEAMVNKNTQAVIVNTPNNPSGVVFSRETLKKLGEILGKKSAEFGHPVYLISDEPYRELVYGDIEVPWVPSIYKDTIVCYSYSKSLSLPGERIGYVCIQDQVTDGKALFAAVAGAARVSGHVCPPSLIQRAVAICAYEKPDLEAYDANRTLLYEGLKKIGYECAKPDGAFYLLVKAPGGDAYAFSEKAKYKNLLIVPSDDFGVPGYFRLCYCVSSETITKSLPVFAEVFS